MASAYSHSSSSDTRSLNMAMSAKCDGLAQVVGVPHEEARRPDSHRERQAVQHRQLSRVDALLADVHDRLGADVGPERQLGRPRLAVQASSPRTSVPPIHRSAAHPVTAPPPAPDQCGCLDRPLLRHGRVGAARDVEAVARLPPLGRSRLGPRRAGQTPTVHPDRGDEVRSPEVEGSRGEGFCWHTGEVAQLRRTPSASSTGSVLGTPGRSGWPIALGAARSSRSIRIELSRSGRRCSPRCACRRGWRRSGW